MPRTVLPAAAVLLLSLAAGAAQAQEYVGEVCKPNVSLTGLHFDTAEHARWYKRFWTGECDHILACFPGTPNWNDIVGKLLVKGGPAERAVLTPRACKLGQLVGLEWSREKAVRKINTADLKVLYATLETAADPLVGVAKVEAAAHAKLGR